MTHFVAQLVGWVGTFLVVAAYAAVTSKKVEPRDRRILVMNLFGAVDIGISVYVQQAWPALALQVVWGGIAFTGLIKGRRAP